MGTVNTALKNTSISKKPLVYVYNNIYFCSFYEDLYIVLESLFYLWVPCFIFYIHVASHIYLLLAVFFLVRVHFDSRCSARHFRFVGSTCGDYLDLADLFAVATLERGDGTV